MSSAVAGTGSFLRRYSGSEWEYISSLTNMVIGPSRDVIDVTHLNSEDGYREFIAGFRDGGEVRLNAIYIRETYDTMMVDYLSEVAGDYEIILPDDDTKSFYFKALVNSIDIVMETNDFIAAQVGMKVTGPVVSSVTGGFGNPILLDIAYTATQFNFKFRLPVGKSVTLHWGDGTTTVAAGAGATLVTKTSAYAGADTYNFYVTGDVLELTYIDISSQAFVSGDVSGWSALTNLTYLYCYSTSVSGDVSGWSALTSLIKLYCFSTSVSGDVSSWSALTNLIQLRCYSTSVSGDVSSWSALTNLIQLRCYSTSVDFDGTTAFTLTNCLISLYSNGWTSTQVDNCLAALAGTPVTGCTINIAGTNAVRTSGSDADKATIIDPGNSNTLTVNE